MDLNSRLRLRLRLRRRHPQDLRCLHRGCCSCCCGFLTSRLSPVRLPPSPCLHWPYLGIRGRKRQKVSCYIMHAVDGRTGQEPAGKLTALLPPAKYLAVHAQAHLAGIQPGHLFSESNRKIIRYDIFKASQLCECICSYWQLNPQSTCKTI